MGNLIGQSIGRYHILEQLGEGGMAVVYKAFDTRLERNVAIKVILPSKEHSDKFLKRFEREAKSLAQLSHPNIVKVIDYGEHEGLPYLVMEYLPGGTLKSKLTGKPMTWQEASMLLLPIARALAYAHIRKIVHRDLKPSNILVTESGEPMLSDFGIAKILEAEETLDLTGTGVGIGTPEYMSPEQAQGKQVDARADIYSIGIVLYEMVTGRKPYQADTPYAVVIKHVNEPLPRPIQFVKNLPDSLERVLLKALAKDPEERYQSMNDFATALVQMDPQDSVLHPAVKSGRRRFHKNSILSITLIGVVLLIVGFWAFQSRATIRPFLVPTQPDEIPKPTLNQTASGYIITRGQGPHLNIVFMNPDGTEFVPLVDLQGKNQVSSLSPDETKIAFASDNDGDNDIYIFDFSTQNIRKLIDTPTTEWNPVWSPNGKELAFVSDFAGSFDVYIINADGTGMKQITRDPLPEWSPSWSPDGSQIVFQRGDESSEQSDLYILNVATGASSPVTHDAAFDGYPSWSPDGSKIAFASNLNGNLDIFAISPDGTQRSIVSENQNNEVAPRWSPDGGKLVFSMDIGAGNNDLFLVNFDGTALTRLTNTPENEMEPVWLTRALESPSIESEGTYLILEDFEDNEVQMHGFSAQAGWQIVNDGTDNNVYEVDNRQGTEYSSFSFGDDEWRNYIAEYQVKYLNEAGSIGLQVRSDGMHSYVEDLSIGELYLAFATPNEWSRITTAFPPVETQSWHTVRVAVQGDSIQVYVDGNRWIDEVDSRYQNGWLLMFASPGTHAQVDNLRVWENSDGQTASGGDILLDQSHEGLTVDLETAATMVPDNPEFVYIGQFHEGISERYDVSLHENTPMERDVLSGYRVLILTSPNGLYFDKEVAAILDFVEGGGGLLVLGVDGRGNLDQILDPLGVRFRGRPLGSPEHLDWGPWGFQVPVNSTDPLLSGVSQVTVNAGSAVDVDDPNNVSLWTDSSIWIDLNENQEQDAEEPSTKFPIVVSSAYGQGKVVILPAVEVWGGFYNDNEKIFLNALGWLMTN